MGRPKGSKNIFSTNINKYFYICNKKYSVTPFHSNSKYCSYECYWKDLKGKPSWNTGKESSEETRKKISIAFKGKYLREKSPSWKGGRHVTQIGYVLIKNREHPFCNPNGYVFEHRLVMEKNIGRYLRPEEIVHHINEIKHDNRIENLLLLASNSEHLKLHASLRKKNKINGKFI